MGKHFQNSRESIEAKANELGISFEELLELENEFEVFSNKIKNKNKTTRKKMIEGGRNGGNNVSSEDQSIKGKISAKINMESGQVHDVFVKAGNTKVKEMIESGEWTEIAAKGGDSTAANWDGQLEHMRGLHKKVDHVKKAKRKIAKNKKIRQEFINEVLSELPNEFTNREAEELVVLKGKGSHWCRRWLYKDPRVTKIKFDGKISYFLQNKCI